VTFTAAVLVALAVFLFQNRGYILETYSLQPRVFGTIALLVVATLGLRAVANRLLFGGLGVAASLFDWFRLICVVAFSNYLPLSAGLLAKAFFLKRVHAVPYRRFAVGQMSLLLMVFGTNGLVGLVTLALAMPSQLVGVIGLGFALMLASAGLLFLPLRARSWAGVRRLPWEPQALLGARRSWPGVALCQTGILLLGAASLYLCFGLGTSHVGFPACLLFTAAAAGAHPPGHLHTGRHRSPRVLHRRPRPADGLRGPRRHHRIHPGPRSRDRRGRRPGRRLYSLALGRAECWARWFGGLGVAAL